MILDRAMFERDGFVGPISLFTEAECNFLCQHLKFGDVPKPLNWDKGRFATDRIIYDFASRPRLLTMLSNVLGENIVLWGANVLVREPGDVHPWHTDIETSAPEGCFASVWIGIQNTTVLRSLKLVRHSHRFGLSLQEAAAKRGKGRGEASDELVLTWAKERDAGAALVQLDITDGEAIIFDGRLWHASAHEGTEQRVALLLQYAPAGTCVQIPDLTQLEWPFRNLKSARSIRAGSR